MTQDRFSRFRSVFATRSATTLLVITGLLAAGCGSGPRSGYFRDPNNAPKPLALRGEAKYFDGQLAATVSISRGFEMDEEPDSSDGAKADGSKPAGGSSRGGGGGRGRGGRGGGGGGYGGGGADYSQIDLPDPDDKDYAESISKIMRLQIRGSPMPPITLRVVLANTSQQPIEVDISEVNSDLGNFAVQPEKLTIPAGKSAEPYPMNSQIGLIGDNFPVKVSLRVGEKTESQTITVKSLFNPDGTRR